MSDSTMYYAYLIAPMDKPGTPTRENYNTLKNFIRDALEDRSDGCVIKGGDDVLEDGQVYDQVIKEIKKAHFCIADISEQNVNVYYEIGFCKAMEKPMIFLKRQNSEEVPVDLGNPKWVDYDLEHGFNEARQAKIKLRGHCDSIIAGLKNKSSSDTGKGTGFVMVPVELAELLYSLYTPLEKLINDSPWEEPLTNRLKEAHKIVLPNDKYLEDVT